ncbi:VOC family protein [Chryseobacterium sp. MP_3.2]|uniref:VOC family protein n=1 Tax=Chryseobacterium sp. MP_3.2 TaxID=3071712 RepID=UPI002DF84141|nr:PhnB protein [Chryseobacterium sp. MP_3.2]
MATINPYLMFNGNCKEAFEFYKEAFGKEFAEITHFGDMAAQEGSPELTEAQKKMVMHVRMPISEETVLYGSDIFPGTPGFTVGDNFSVSISTDSREETDNLFTKLSAGGNVTMPLADTFWGAYFGMWRDKFGIDWMVNFDDPFQVQPH